MVQMTTGMWMRSDMLSHLLKGACAYASKATPTVPTLCLDHFLSDAVVPFVTTLILWCLFRVLGLDQTLLYSGLSNEILISAPLLLRCVLQKKNQYSARQ